MLALVAKIIPKRKAVVKTMHKATLEQTNKKKTLNRRHNLGHRNHFPASEGNPPKKTMECKQRCIFHDFERLLKAPGRKKIPRHVFFPDTGKNGFFKPYLCHTGQKPTFLPSASLRSVLNACEKFVSGSPSCSRPGNC